MKAIGGILAGALLIASILSGPASAYDEADYWRTQRQLEDSRQQQQEHERQLDDMRYQLESQRRQLEENRMWEDINRSRQRMGLPPYE